MSTTHTPFRTMVSEILEETFERHHGIYLDKGTSLLETLSRLSADEASTPVGGHCATIAAQVEHVIFYIEVLALHISSQDVGPVDWDDIWNRVSSVTPAEWANLQTRLKLVYEKLNTELQSTDFGTRGEAVEGSMAILVHTAYHLGEIRQALCTVAVKPDK